VAEDTTKPSGDRAGTGDATPPSGGRSASELRVTADALRNRIDLFGKTLAAIATLGTTAVGLKKIGDLFPAEGHWEWVWVVAACLGLGVAALAAIGVAVRLMLVAGPVFVDADLEGNSELDLHERNKVRLIFDQAAKRFDYTSLVGLQERERSLRNAASWTGDKDERARRTALADEVKVEIEQALARGQVVVIRRRSTRAVSDAGAWALYAAVIVGLITFALGTDRVSSDRRDRVADAKACGDARKAGATSGELGRAKDICDAEAMKASEEGKPPAAAEARAQITAKLAAALEACTALVQKSGDAKSGPLKNEECDAVRRAVSGMDPVTP
jgi:hypothetical protein